MNNKQGKTKTNWYSLYQENTHDRHLGDGGPVIGAGDTNLNLKTESTVRVSVTRDKLEGAL